jgi:hypothetical protein
MRLTTHRNTCAQPVRDPGLRHTFALACCRLKKQWLRLFMAVLIPTATPPLLNADDLHAPIQPGSKVTYADLLRIVFPAYKQDNDDPSAIVAETSAPVRHSDNSRQPWDGPLKVTGFANANIQISDSRQFLLTFHVDEGGNGAPTNAYALFKLEPKPVLLDLIEAPGFPDDPGHVESKLNLGPRTEALVYGCNHFNSQQGYEGSSILYVWGERINTLSEIGLLSCKGCSDGDFEQSIAIDAIKDPEREFNQVEIKVTLKRDADPPGSEHRPRRRAYRRVFSATYRWDPAKHEFTTLSLELKALKAFNKRNY